MNFFTDILKDLGIWFLSNDREVALAAVATALIIFGEDINSIVRRALKPFHFFVRFLGFILLCALGYGFLTVYATRFLTQSLHQVNLIYVPLLVGGIFIGLALFASKRNQV